MAAPPTKTFPKLHNLPASFPAEGAVRIELEAGVPVFRTSAVVQERIETLLDRQHERDLSPAEIEELDRYEEVDDYLSFLNRLVRNQLDPQQIQEK